MKSAVLFASLFMLMPTFAQESAPQIPFDSNPDFFQLPNDVHFGEASGVAVNSKGHVYVFSRGSTTGPAYGAAAAQVFEFDEKGKYIREVGKNLYAWSFAHAIRVDKQDNLWAIDKGSDMIIRFNPQGRVSMVFGRKKEASDEAAPWTRVNPPRPPVDGQFRQPTDVTWDPQGNIYISDGYINSRVAKYDANGDWVKSFGEPGNGPGQLNTPHSIAADAKGQIYVADRGNRRVQVFDADGNYVASWTDFGTSPDGIFIAADDTMYVADVSMESGGIRIASARDGKVRETITGARPEGLAVDSHGTIYSGETTSGRSLKVFARP